MISHAIIYVITAILCACGLYYVFSLPFGGFSAVANEHRGARLIAAIILLIGAWFFAWLGGI
ncbi:hypothetical protein G6L12_08125 [Agrobacterium rhizogenes]|nr:hypothetical protein [Rhizobium rhizogenes]NTF74439.1 hypothetical protein [Rhizobium rhizogenes]